MLNRQEILIGMLMGYSKCRDEIMGLFDSADYKTNEFTANAYNIVKYIGERSITVTILLQDNMLWDAQILMRPVQEAAMKICFLCNCTPEEQQERLKEYLHDLKEINSLKQSRIAKNLVAAFKDDKSFQLPFLPLILDSKEEEILQAKWTAKKRKQLEQKWSFSEMIKEQANKMKEIELQFTSLAHPYKMSSHLIHADETGIGIIAERSLRSVEEQEIIEMAHFCGLITDSVNYLIVCGYALCIYFKKDPKIFHEISKELTPIYEEIELHQARLYEDPLYDKFR
jgi:hypothetical protein